MSKKKKVTLYEKSRCKHCMIWYRKSRHQVNCVNLQIRTFVLHIFLHTREINSIIFYPSFYVVVKTNKGKRRPSFQKILKNFVSMRQWPKF